MSRLAGLLGADRPLVMGILNITPDSFADGGKYLHPERAVAHGLRMIEEGADIVDIGGESTRPGAAAVSVQQEIERVLPVVRALRQRSDAAISLDSSKPAVMAAAMAEGIDLINDVRALREAGALELLAKADPHICLMHMQGEPGTMQRNPQYRDLLREVRDFLIGRITACEQAGIDRQRLILDIGFGFGKTPEHNLTLVNRLPAFTSLGLPLLVGLSRKSTIAKIVDDLVIGSVSGALAAVSKGARILRVHDVGPTVAALEVWRAITGEGIAAVAR